MTNQPQPDSTEAPLQDAFSLLHALKCQIISNQGSAHWESDSECQEAGKLIGRLRDSLQAPPESQLAEQLQAACRTLQAIEGVGRLVMWQTKLWTALEDAVSKTTGRIHYLTSRPEEERN